MAGADKEQAPAREAGAGEAWRANALAGRAAEGHAQNVAAAPRVGVADEVPSGRMSWNARDHGTTGGPAGADVTIPRWPVRSGLANPSREVSCKRYRLRTWGEA